MSTGEKVAGDLGGIKWRGFDFHRIQKNANAAEI